MKIFAYGGSVAGMLALMFGIGSGDAALAETTALQPQAGMTLSAAELRLWNDPDFKKNFTHSYLSETDIEPRLTADERERMQKVMELMAANDMAGAVALLEKHRGKAASAVFDFTLANIHFQQESFDQAAAGYQLATEKHPKFRRAWRNLALIYVRRNEFTQALPALTRVIELGGADALTYGLLGFAHASLENNLSAESAYRLAILLDPGTVDWQMGLARSLFKQQRFAEAATLCGELISRYPERADLWLLQANAYIGMNRALAAAGNFEFVDRLGHSSPESLTMLADIYTNEGIFPAAISAYVRALETSNARKPERALRAAKVMIARGAVPYATELLERVETLCRGVISPEEQKELLKLRARLLLAQGAGEAEARVLEEIVALDPLDGDALILLGQYNSRQGNAEKAIFYFERAAGIERYAPDAKIRHAQLLVGAGKYSEALPLLQQAQQLDPRDTVQKYLEQVERLAKNR